MASAYGYRCIKVPVKLKRETDQSDILMMSPLHDLIGQSQHRSKASVDCSTGMEWWNEVLE